MTTVRETREFIKIDELIRWLMYSCEEPFPMEQLSNEFDSCTWVPLDYLENILEYIEEKKFDILITSLVSIKDSVIELENIFLHSDKMYFVAAPCFPLANKEVITKDDLKKYPQIILKAKSSRDYGIVNNEKKWNVNDFFLKKQLIMHGIGYGSLPEFYILEELKNGKLIHLTNYPDFEDLKVNFYAFRNKNIKHGKVSNEFWDFIKNIT